MGRSYASALCRPRSSRRRPRWSSTSVPPTLGPTWGADVSPQLADPTKLRPLTATTSCSCLHDPRGTPTQARGASVRPQAARTVIARLFDQPSPEPRMKRVSWPRGLPFVQLVNLALLLGSNL